MAGYVIVLVQTFFAPRMIIPLAYDSGGVTTSTVTVPLVAALGLGVGQCHSGAKSGRLMDLGSLPLPVCFQSLPCMAFAQISVWWAKLP